MAAGLLLTNIIMWTSLAGQINTANVWSKTSFTLWKFSVMGEGGTYSESEGWGAVTHDGNSWRRKQQENENIAVRKYSKQNQVLKNCKQPVLR